MAWVEGVSCDTARLDTCAGKRGRVVVTVQDRLGLPRNIRTQGAGQGNLSVEREEDQQMSSKN